MNYRLGRLYKKEVPRLENIIEGISQGLLYLHKYSRLKIIHRDLKASNILLDDNMNTKISYFGMARMFAQQEFIVKLCLVT
ncbi:putative protein kinase RLK-Pelle-DLSV family [Medicago truncatula]|uniref:non-specific serine/threonine protein kinase n=1 Tax=Medicago truncatula TaxID=3880 RepID=A0A396GHV1_MEDTR|nr:putative protein kinase RLK-Pelle-DLSV family [Medicago truncatula]